MGLLDKSSIARPVRKAQAVEVPELGGEVAVRQMTLSIYLDSVRYGVEHGGQAPVSMVLADCVVDADDHPIFSQEEWEAWGMQHAEAALGLYERIRDMTAPRSLEDAAKN